jgi:hypothetical protein
LGNGRTAANGDGIISGHDCCRCRDGFCIGSLVGCIVNLRHDGFAVNGCVCRLRLNRQGVQGQQRRQGGGCDQFE